MENETFVPWNSHLLTIDPFHPLDDRLIVGFSTREKGYSMEPYHSLNVGLHVQDDPEKVILNRKLVADEIKIPLSNWVFSQQVHSNNIHKVKSKDCGSGSFLLDTAIKDVDGLYTDQRNILLASLYADCVPLYFYSSKTPFLGLAHAGWKGTVGKIGPNMIQLWVDKEKVPLQSIYVAIGPSISMESYEVDDFVIERVKPIITNGESDLPYKKSKPNKYLLDLKKLNKQLLIAAGINENQIFVSNYCTYRNNEYFFSYRRSQQTGRMMSFIGRK